jgi:sulfite reductase alpha subunit-like flavoprotein
MPHSGAKLNIEIQKGLITLPPSINIPIICVGPGTGVAPMRAIIEERLNLLAECMYPLF